MTEIKEKTLNILFNFPQPPTTPPLLTHILLEAEVLTPFGWQMFRFAALVMATNSGGWPAYPSQLFAPFLE